jgi:TonB family protein
MHAYYPRHASNNDEGGTVKLHLVVLPDGRVWSVDVVGSSGSRSLDAAGYAAFRDGFVRPFPEGEPQADIDISLRYILAHRHDEAMPVGYTPVLSRSHFSITSDPVKSASLDTILQRTCTGTVVKGGSEITPGPDILLRPGQSSFASLMARHGSSLMHGATTASLRWRKWATCCSGPGMLSTLRGVINTSFFSTPHGLTAITISPAPWVPSRLMVLASRIIQTGERSISPAQQKYCPRLHGICLTPRTPERCHPVIHPDGGIWMDDMVKRPGSH